MRLHWSGNIRLRHYRTKHGRQNCQAINMEYLCDNCVREIKCPTGNINSFDYSSEHNLIASFRYGGENVVIWNPDTGEVVAQINTRGIQDEVLFLPGNYVAVLWNPMEFCPSSLVIYSISPLEKVSEITLPFTLSMPLVLIALSSINNLLVASNTSIVELDLKMELEPNENSQSECLYSGDYIQCMCCSKSRYDVCITEGQGETYSFKCLRVDESSPAGKDVRVTRGEEITHCFIDGKEKEFGYIRSLAHDGESVIVATEDDIIVLESATEGSIGHVILSSGISTDNYYDCLRGEMKANNKGQLLVSDGSDTIKVYEYKRPIALKRLCRQQINMTLKSDREDKVESLPIPRNMKNYLLYKV